MTADLGVWSAHTQSEATCEAGEALSGAVEEISGRYPQVMQALREEGEQVSGGLRAAFGASPADEVEEHPGEAAPGEALSAPITTARNRPCPPRA